jgi:hypothetical protein
MMKLAVPVLAVVGAVVVGMWIWNSWGPGANG